MKKWIASRWTPHLLLAAAVLAVWGHTVTFGFVWDDFFFIRDLQVVRSLSHVPEMFTRLDAQSTLPEKFILFRPLRTAQYALLHALAGQEVPPPWIYHLANVLWHAATAMMIFAAVNSLFAKLRPDWNELESRAWALFVALAFAVHPVTSEVVCWAKSLDDLMATFFTLASLRELLCPPDDKAARWRALLWFTLACYSKESAVPFAALPFLVDTAIHRRRWREAAWRTAAFLALGFIYMAHRAHIMGRSSQIDPISGSYAQTLVDTVAIAQKYFRLIWGVPPFYIDYRYLHGGNAIFSANVLCGAFIIATLALAAILAWKKPALRAAGFGLFWAGLFLLPVSNLLPMMQYMAERFLYLPLIGCVLAIGALLAWLPQRRVARLAAALLLCVWAAVAWQRSWIWRDEVTLFITSSTDNPKAERVAHNAVAAVIHLPQMSRFFAWDARTDHILVQNQIDSASRQAVLRTLASVRALLPDNHGFNELYGIALGNTGDPAAALPFLQQAADAEPTNADYWLNLARAQVAVGRLDAAAQAAARARTLAPKRPEPLQTTFSIQWRQGDFAAARETVLRWRALAPNDENAHWLGEVEAKLAEKKP